MTTGKKILIGAIVLIGLIAIYGYNKAVAMKAVFDKIIIKPNSLPRNIKINLNTVEFIIDILLQNPSSDDFAVSGYVATLTKINVFYKNNFIGQSVVNIDEISVPAKDTLVLHDIQVVLQVDNLLSYAADFLQPNINDFSFTGVVSVLGNEYEIGA